MTEPLGGYEYFEEVKPASHSLKKREMWQMLAELDTNEEFWPDLLARISDGEFISEVAKAIEVHHSILRNWIRGNKGREQAFQQAESQGKAHRAEQVLKMTYGVATAEVKELPTRMEQLRAAEIMLKQQPERRAPSTIANIAITFVAAKDGKPAEPITIDQVP